MLVVPLCDRGIIRLSAGPIPLVIYLRYVIRNRHTNAISVDVV